MANVAFDPSSRGSYAKGQSTALALGGSAEGISYTTDPIWFLAPVFGSRAHPKRQLDKGHPSKGPSTAQGIVVTQGRENFRHVKMSAIGVQAIRISMFDPYPRSCRDCKSNRLGLAGIIKKTVRASPCPTALSENLCGYRSVEGSSRRQHKWPSDRDRIV